jgi:GntR family transcriptional regulator of arabinose operon
VGSDPDAKHRRIYQAIRNDIVAGEYAVGQRIPTEAALAAQHGASRPTVARALRELERGGYLIRHRGVGSFVGDRQQASGKVFGLIVPWPGQGIFSSICNAIVRESEAHGYVVLLSGSLMAEGDVMIAQEEAFCGQLIARKVAGVFFGPLDVHPGQAFVNSQVADRLDKAGIPLVLLDRDICDVPGRGAFDLVGVDNRKEEAVITEHLLALGCRRIEFITHDWVVSTVSARIEGFKDALGRHGLATDAGSIHRWDPNDRDFVRNLMRPPHAEAFVCVNDLVAASLMHNLAVLGIRVPDDVRLVGFDDIDTAARLPVPLTTMRQPAAHIGTVAVKVLLDRIENPRLPVRETTLACELVVRESCGAKRQTPAASTVSTSAGEPAGPRFPTPTKGGPETCTHGRGQRLPI